VLILSGIVGGLISRVVHETPFGIVDRLLGLLVALLLVLAAWIILLALVAALSPQGADSISQSPLAALLVGLFPEVSGTLADLGIPL
ncbi:MAG TPA: hypothetical protein ENL12_02730, partial [Dehalococcoidia bacterium]|nr:hypothetical protein [Dehalococcoidia bacterium]